MTESHTVPSSEVLAAACAADGEFVLAARYWHGGLRLEIGDHIAAMRIEDGAPVPGDPGEAEGVITLSGPAEVWAGLLAELPPRFLNDVQSALEIGLRFRGAAVLWAQYFPAIMRALELLRPAAWEKRLASGEAAPAGAIDAAVGRYVHVDVLDRSYRVYFEEAGQGIPLLLQHTAGCHGSQWRHLMECPAITDHFRLIAYDLPYHGKSLPPVGPKWWEEEYKLTGGFLRSFVINFANALSIEQPVFMGCSVGGLLALDLARHHPDAFRAVISLEGGLRIDYDIEKLFTLWHPQVSNEFKARSMNGLMSPTAPVEYRKETSQVYSAGWPPVFLGDLHYYMVDFDLRGEASEIDTTRCPVHILSGEYDFSGTVELGREAHEAIAGSTWKEMKGVGHFPMSEDPERFIEELCPVLDHIRSA